MLRSEIDALFTNATGPAPEAAAQQQNPQQHYFGRFKLIHRLSAGHDEELWRVLVDDDGARPRELDLRLFYSRNPACVDRFLAEAEINRSLSQPNLTPVRDRGLRRGLAYTTREVEDGATLGTLQRMLSGPALTVKSAVGIGLDVANALAYVHDHCDALGEPLDLVHGDLCPEGIFVASDGTAKISAARFSHFEGCACRSGRLGYMSPEQLRGASPTPSCDLFALGLIVIELLIGARFIWDGRTTLQDVEAVVHALGEVRRDVSSDLVALLTSLVELDPRRRPASASAVARILEEVWRRAKDNGVEPGSPRMRLCEARAGAFFPRPMENPPPLRPLRRTQSALEEALVLQSAGRGELPNESKRTDEPHPPRLPAKRFAHDRRRLDVGS